MRHTAKNSLSLALSFRATNKRETPVLTDQSCHREGVRYCGVRRHPQYKPPVVAMVHNTAPLRATVPSPPKWRATEPLGTVPRKVHRLVSTGDQAWSPDSLNRGGTSTCSQGRDGVCCHSGAGSTTSTSASIDPKSSGDCLEFRGQSTPWLHRRHLAQQL